MTTAMSSADYNATLAVQRQAAAAIQCPAPQPLEYRLLDPNDLAGGTETELATISFDGPSPDFVAATAFFRYWSAMMQQMAGAVIVSCRARIAFRDTGLTFASQASIASVKTTATADPIADRVFTLLEPSQPAEFEQLLQIQPGSSASTAIESLRDAGGGTAALDVFKNSIDTLTAAAFA